MAGVTLGAHGTYVANAAASVADGAWRVALGCVAAVLVRATAVEEKLSGVDVDDASARAAVEGSVRRSTRRPTSTRRSSTGAASPRRRPCAPSSRQRSERGAAVSVTPTSSQVVTVTVNGHAYEHEGSARRLLVHFLRDDLSLTGTHIGCDTGSAACTVHLDGVAAKSCAVLAVQADGAQVTTVEGLAGEELTPLQKSFSEHHASSSAGTARRGC